MTLERFLEGGSGVPKLYDLKMTVKHLPIIREMLARRNAKMLEESLREGRELLHSVGYDVAARVCESLSAEGLVFFFDFGTLLGFVRDGGFIAHDDDLDVGVIMRDDSDWEKIEKALIDSGFVKEKEFTLNGATTEQTYRYDGLGVDFFRHFDNGDHQRVYYYERAFEVRYRSACEFSATYIITVPISQTTSIYLDRGSFPVPSNAEDYLLDVYGDTWRTPLNREERKKVEKPRGNRKPCDSFGLVRFF